MRQLGGWLLAVGERVDALSSIAMSSVRQVRRPGAIRVGHSGTKDVMLESKVVTTPSGPVAQLGARMNGIHEVTGSIPVWSTNSKSLIPNGRNREPRPQFGPLVARCPLPRHLSQFSTFKAGTRLNSATLSVTQTASMARACAAISMSCALIGVPFFSSATRRDA